MLCTDFLRQLPEGPLAVAVSGGVDSLAALLICLESGRQVLAIHARMWRGACSAQAEAEARACEERLAETVTRLGAAFHLLSLETRFEAGVVHPFVEAWKQGLTPNPCALCNRRIKFGALLEEAERLGAAALVTGHYARLDREHPYSVSHPLLARAADERKDQSYFLGLVQAKCLSRVAFPLSGLGKDEVRSLVAGRGLAVPQPVESQEICFVPETRQGYRDFLGQYGVPMSGGDIIEVDSGRVIGRHTGLWQYTEGQRRGLGIAWSEPLYVLGKDAASNTLFVGTREHTLVRRARVISPSFMIPAEELPHTCLVRLRYRQRPVQASVRADAGGMDIVCAQPLSLSAPGQVAVCYDEAGRVLAAGLLHSLSAH